MSQFGFDDFAEEIDKALTTHRIQGSKEYPRTYGEPELTLIQSYTILSTLSNNHWAKYIVNDNSQRVTQMKNSRLDCCRSYQAKQIDDGVRSKTCLPTSFRNRLVAFIVKNQPHYISTLLKFHYDNIVPLSGVPVPPIVDDDVDIPTLPQTQGDQADCKVPRASRNVGQTSISIDNFINMAEEQTVFSYFKDRVSTSSLIWRLHNDHYDVIAMNDYNLQGKKIPNDFVHIYRTARQDEEPLFRCTCRLYKSLHRCLHTRYLIECVNNHIYSLFAGLLKDSNSFLHIFLQKSLSKINNGVVIMSDASAIVKKFSVVAITNTNHSFVELSADNFLTCQNSYCQVKNRHKRKSDTLINSGDNICLHLEVMRANLEIWQEYLHHEQDELQPMNDKVAIDIFIYTVYFIFHNINCYLFG